MTGEQVTAILSQIWYMAFVIMAGYFVRKSITSEAFVGLFGWAIAAALLILYGLTGLGLWPLGG